MIFIGGIAILFLPSFGNAFAAGCLGLLCLGTPGIGLRATCPHLLLLHCSRMAWRNVNLPIFFEKDWGWFLVCHNGYAKFLSTTSTAPPERVQNNKTIILFQQEIS